MASILVADDDAHIVRVLAIWLQRNGHRVMTARNGREALELIETNDVDLVISDMNMPILDGAGLAEALRKGIGADMPILMLTARCDHAAMREKLAPLNVSIFPKPFLPSQLVAEVDRRLGSPIP